MGKFIDLSGQKFGKLTVIKKSENKTNSGRLQWECLCECGNICLVTTDHLKSGHTTSCGCNKLKFTTDEIGKRYGRLVVISRALKHNNEEAAYWQCKCDCGKIVEVRGASLRSGKTLSCGCYHSEITSTINNNPEDLSNQKFGKLTAIKCIGRNKYRNAIWECQCDCGKTVEVSAHCLKNGNTKSCGCLGSSYGEYKIDYILSQEKIPYKREYVFSDLYDQQHLRFDFALFKGKNLISLIEFNGSQHFDSTNLFYSTTLVKHDKMKQQYCIDHNIPLFNINYNDNLEEKMKEVINHWKFSSPVIK